MTRLLTVGSESGNILEGSPSSTFNATSDNTQARTGARSVRILGSTSTGIVYPLGGANQTDVWMRIGFRYNNLASVGSTCVNFIDSNGTTEMRFTISSITGQIACIVNVTTVFTTSATFAVDTWYGLEMHYIPNSSGGVITLYADGVQVGTFTGNTRAGLVNNIFSLGLLCNTNNATFYFDDIAVNNTAGAVNNGRIADGAGRVGGIHGLKPVGDNSVQWTPLSGPSNYLMVNEVPANGDTSYVYDSTAGHQDLYDLEDLPGTASSIACVQELVTARNSDASGNQISEVTDSGGTVTTDPAVILSQSYVLKTGVLQETDPHTTMAWDTAGVNALLAGQVTV